MKIGIILSKTPSYSETFFNSKISKLLESGHTVTVFSEKSPKYDKTKVCEPLSKNLFGIISFTLKTLSQLSVFYKFYKQERHDRKSSKRALKNTFLNAHILSCKLDWLHFGYATLALQRENVAYSINAKMGVSFRGYDINVYPLRDLECYHLLWERVDKVHSISNYLLQKAYQLGLKKETPYQIIYPAIDFDKIEKSISKIDDSNVIHIVSVARLNWIKGVQYAIPAMKMLRDRGFNIEYTVIGGGNKQEYEYNRFLIKEFGLEKKVILKGACSHEETLMLLSKATIYLQPSIGEGFCNAVLEAQAMGKLCIVTNAGGLIENIINRKTGWVILKADSLNIASKIEEVLRLPDSEKKEICCNAREQVKKAFSIAKQQEQFVAYYS